ncbi:MAG: aminopeptidase [Bacteroidales bacterium]|nr:aminopeptidase [Bacteroidales bacterium]
MKIYRPLIAIAAFAAALNLSAQPKAPAATPDYQFTTVKENPITPVKNQYRSGTCWCFSAISFLESEAIRLNNIKDSLAYPDFSEMFVVSHSYQDRADKYIRLDGNLVFAAGSECEDVLHIMQDYGLVPQEVMTGMNYGTPLPVQGELDAVLKAYVEAIAKNPNKTLSTAWKNGFKGILDAYLGETPEEFEHNGKKYTPASYRDSYKLNADDYVTLTSFTHHPFYKKFAVEVCDNWRGDQAYNVPLDEFMDALYYALEHGYTATWGGDVSEIGFTRNGIGILVDTDAKVSAGSDQERWTGKASETAEEKKSDLPKEKTVSQEDRQLWFDNKQTTDDHGMHAFGIATDQNGTRYVMIKNSWGKTGKYDGIWYLSDAFTRGKAIDFMVHKDALPKELKKKLGIK